MSSSSGFRLLWLSVLAVAVRGAFPHTKLEHSLAQSCKFAIDDRNYNLCPLFSARARNEWTISSEHPTPPTVTTVEYRIALDGPLKVNGTLPKHEQCEEGTWVCMTTTNRRPDHRSEPPRVTQLVPIVSNATSPEKRPNAEPFGVYALAKAGVEKDGTAPPLVLVMNGGYYVDAPQRSLIRFYCVSRPNSQKSPTYAWSYNGTHAFDWRTNAACASTAAKPVPPKPTPGSDGDTPPDVPTPPDELILPVRDGISKATVSMILLSTAVALFLLAYAAMYPPAFVRRRIAPHARRLGRAARRLRRWRGRPGEVKLIRWAEEDLPIFVLGDDEDLDLDSTDNDGVALADARQMAEGGLGEERIPLRPSPSPRAGYGATGPR